MRYPRQDKVIERLEIQGRIVSDKIRARATKEIKALWESAKRLMRSDVITAYREDFGNGNWNLVEAAQRKTLRKIDLAVGRTLGTFHQESLSSANRHFRKMYKQSALHHAYMLDVTTPPSYKIKLPNSPVFREAGITVYQGPDADTGWKVRWSAWVDSYQSSLNQNLKLGAMNQSTVGDAMDEIDATRAGTPASDVGDALNRIMASQAVALQAQAALDVADVNSGIEMEEIWQTRYNDRVCDDCDANLGLTIDEADSDIPLHPNCECYWRLVPASWSELLRSGDANEQDLAQLLDARGEMPSAMLIRNDDGDIVGQAVVSFERWLEGQPQVVTAG